MKKQSKSVGLIIIFSILIVFIFCHYQFRLDTREEYVDSFVKDKAYFEKVSDKIEDWEFENVHNVDSFNNILSMLHIGLNFRICFKYHITEVCFNACEQYNYVEFNFANTVQGFEYAGIYYSSNNEPRDLDRLTYDENRQMYVEDNSNYTLEVEQICDNWFYYQQHWYRGL